MWDNYEKSVIKEGKPRVDIEARRETDESEKPEVNVDVLWTQRDNQDRWIEKILQNQVQPDDFN